MLRGGQKIGLINNLQVINFANDIPICTSALLSHSTSKFSTSAFLVLVFTNFTNYELRKGRPVDSASLTPI